MSARRILLPVSLRGAPRITHLLPRHSSKAAPASSTKLTEIECEVLRWLSFGKRFGEISEIMAITVNAAHQCVHRIKDKLGANTSAGAVGKALRDGLIE